MPNLVSLTRLSLQILDKTLTGVFSIYRFLVKSFINKNCQNSRTSNDIDLKLGQVTKLDKRNTTRLKHLTKTSCQQAMTLFFFGFVVDFDVWSIILKFSLIATSYVTKIQNRTKKSLIQLSYYCFQLRYYFTEFLQRKKKS